jgi:hypothetical protein
LGGVTTLLVGIVVLFLTASAATSATAPSGAAPQTGTVTVTVANPSHAQGISAAFWGADVVAGYPFTATDAKEVAATPVNFLKFPGGTLGEEFNYTSAVVTNPTGTSYTAVTTTQDFVTACQSIHCQAILQLPAEIDQPHTAADYAAYVVNSLHFQPAYWEIGNSVPGWTHFQTPWANWSFQGGTAITPTLFAGLVGQYITAVRAVDAPAHFIALGAAMGQPGYDGTWITALAKVDGPNLSGISVHSYTMGKSPANPTPAQLLANLNGVYSLPSQVGADRGYIESACPTCSLSVFVTEANAAEVNNYSALDSTFAGTLYIAADTAQALDLRLTSLDWYCYDCRFAGSWETSPGKFGLQYELLSRMMPLLGNETLNTTVSGSTSFYAAATYGVSGLSLLLVNTNSSQSVSFSLAPTGIVAGSSALRERWENGTSGPHNSTITLGRTVVVPALTMEILVVPPGGVSGASGEPAGPTVLGSVGRMSSVGDPPAPSPLLARPVDLRAGARSPDGT